jgi:hypothetical protein
MALPEDPLQRLAKILAQRDLKEGGGFRHGAWGAAFMQWTAIVVRDHKGCGRIDTSPVQEFAEGETNTCSVICPVHGRLDGPEMPT